MSTNTIGERKIPLRVSNNTAYLWNIDDIATLRSEHHICGILTGTLPHLSQQNVFLGIPLVLLPEEVVTLVENEVAVIVNDPAAHQQPSVSEMESWNDEQQASFRKQVAENEVRAAQKDTSRSLSEEALKKRKEREERRRLAAQKLVEEASTEDINLPTYAPNNSQPEVLCPESSTEQLAASANYTITIPAASEYQWYQPDQTTFTTIEAAQKAGIWTYPASLNERARCGVFRSLLAQGYFMGSGIKFGGDYLVYPVIESPKHVLRPMEVVAHGRLGTATKKSHLLCTWDDDRKEVRYFSIEWAGFG
ncbi:hypothetical protein NP233_g5426 [Leucocoprinus birnbaumii]|uniref:tRNA-splicing endonuclease subunit Sen34 n=1 Tax=Leucocoprinus birnbaumii TaxID=56174 RepID=A0AAD5YUM3_9AGAR|nr:hypothetical protein NP233_g5426 [Leucocoprinus birnbaumii]